MTFKNRPFKVSGWNVVTVLLIVFFLWKQIPIWLTQSQVEDGHLERTALMSGDYSSFFLPNGKPVVLIFWTTWCGPCKIELKLFDWAVQWGLDGSRVIGVNMGEDPSLVREYWNEAGYSFRLALDPSQSLADQLRIMATPTLAMIGPDGRIARISSGLSLLGPIRSAAFLSKERNNHESSAP